MAFKRGAGEGDVASSFPLLTESRGTNSAYCSFPTSFHLQRSTLHLSGSRSSLFHGLRQEEESGHSGLHPLLRRHSWPSGRSQPFHGKPNARLSFLPEALLPWEPCIPFGHPTRPTVIGASFNLILLKPRSFQRGLTLLQPNSVH